MIVLPDGKVCRNLPEQVAENLKKIQEIIHFLDGVNIQDNFIVIADMSQILTAAEIEIVERPVAFIYYNAELYIKKNEAAGVAYFVNVFSIEDTGTQLNFNSNEIEVDLGTGALTYATATASSYTKSQIDSLLALKANDSEVAKLTGAAFTGSITAPSIIEDMSGYSFVDKDSRITIQYLGVVKNGNKITFAASGYILSTAQINTYTTLRIARIGIPFSIGSKLYVNDLSYLEQKRVLLFKSLYATKDLIFLFQKNNDTQVELQFTTAEASIPANEKYNFRVETTFLLSDSLAS